MGRTDGRHPTPLRQRWLTRHSTLARPSKPNSTTAVLPVDRAPDATWNHPTPDHLLPLFVVLGASADSKAARQLHSSIDYGVLSTDAYEL